MKLYDVPEYRSTRQWPYAISAGCVVYRFVDGKVEVLLLQREPSHSHNPHNEVAYSLPKGHNEFNETLLESAIRETEEEAGCKVEVQTYLGATQRAFKHPAYDVAVEKVSHYFAALWQEDLQTMDGEHDAKIWVSLEKSIELLNAVAPERGEGEVAGRLAHFLELVES